MPKDNNITNSQEQAVVSNQDADAQTNNLPGDKVANDPVAKKTTPSPKNSKPEKGFPDKAHTGKPE